MPADYVSSLASTLCPIWCHTLCSGLSELISNISSFELCSLHPSKCGFPIEIANAMHSAVLLQIGDSKRNVHQHLHEEAMHHTVDGSSHISRNAILEKSSSAPFRGEADALLSTFVRILIMRTLDINH